MAKVRQVKKAKGPVDGFNGVLVAGTIKSAMKAAGGSSADLWKIPVGKIEVLDGFNVRVRDKDYERVVEEITQSIMTEGFYQHCPLAVYVSKEGDKETIYVTNGHRRLEAAKRAIERGCKIEVLPAVVSAKGMSVEDLTVELVRGNEGKALSVYEKARVAKRLHVGYGWKLKVVAERLGLSQFYIEGLLLLMSAPQEVHDMVIENTVSASRAIEMLRTHGADAVAYMREGKEVAAASGESRVRAKHMKPASKLTRMVRKDAPGMYSALKDVTEDPAFGQISEELRKKVTDLLERLIKAEKDDLAAAAQTEQDEAAAASAGAELVSAAGASGAEADKMAQELGGAPAGEGTSVGEAVATEGAASTEAEAPQTSTGGRKAAKAQERQVETV